MGTAPDVVTAGTGGGAQQTSNAQGSSPNQRPLGAFDEGKDDGKDAVIELWEDDYNEDCDEFGEFEDEAIDELFDGTYEEEPGDNLRERSYKDGARSGVLNQIDDIKDECESISSSSNDRQGIDAVNKLWKDTYNEDCDDIFIFTGDAIETFMEGIEGEEFKEGVMKEIIRLQNLCLGESYCEEVGEEAARAIAWKFCQVRTKKPRRRSRSGHSRDDPDILLICRDEAIDYCRDSIEEKVAEFADKSTCEKIDNDIDNLSRREERKLKDKCTEKVEGHIEDADDFFDKSSSSE